MYIYIYIYIYTHAFVINRGLYSAQLAISHFIQIAQEAEHFSGMLTGYLFFCEHFSGMLTGYLFFCERFSWDISWLIL
jgi:hypothetical protein